MRVTQIITKKGGDIEKRGKDNERDKLKVFGSFSHEKDPLLPQRSLTNIPKIFFHSSIIHRHLVPLHNNPTPRSHHQQTSFNSSSSFSVRRKNLRLHLHTQIVHHSLHCTTASSNLFPLSQLHKIIPSSSRLLSTASSSSSTSPTDPNHHRHSSSSAAVQHSHFSAFRFNAKIPPSSLTKPAVYKPSYEHHPTEGDKNKKGGFELFWKISAFAK